MGISTLMGTLREKIMLTMWYVELLNHKNMANCWKLHLGDYIYETGKGTLGKDPRATDPSDEIFTLYGEYS